MKSFISNLENKMEENKVNKHKLERRIRERRLRKIALAMRLNESDIPTGWQENWFPSVSFPSNPVDERPVSRVLKKQKTSKNLFDLMK